MRLGVFGGTFNPIHFGHLRAAEEARQCAGLERVLFVPSAAPPLKSEDLAGIEDRFRMTAMAVASSRFFGISDMECRRAERSYTVDTARALGEQYPGAEIYFILGVDAFMELPMWREPEELVRRMDFIVVARPATRFSELSGSPFIDAAQEELDRLDSGALETLTTKLPEGRSAVLLGTPMLDISSTAIREHVRHGRSIKYLLPEKVESFIMTHGLYNK